MYSIYYQTKLMWVLESLRKELHKKRKISSKKTKENIIQRVSHFYLNWSLEMLTSQRESCLKIGSKVCLFHSLLFVSAGGGEGWQFPPPSAHQTTRYRFTKRLLLSRLSFLTGSLSCDLSACGYSNITPTLPAQHFFSSPAISISSFLRKVSWVPTRCYEQQQKELHNKIEFPTRP